jgi:hypothetical protein
VLGDTLRSETAITGNESGKDRLVGRYRARE